MCTLTNPHLNVRHFAHDASLFDSFDKSVTGTIVGDGEAKSITRLCDLNLLCPALAVSEDEVIEANGATQEMSHVYSVCIQGAEENLGGNINGISISVQI